jgi:hypothetical protein
MSPCAYVASPPSDTELNSHGCHGAGGFSVSGSARPWPTRHPPAIGRAPVPANFRAHGTCHAHAMRSPAREGRQARWLPVSRPLFTALVEPPPPTVPRTRRAGLPLRAAPRGGQGRAAVQHAGRPSELLILPAWQSGPPQADALGHVPSRPSDTAVGPRGRRQLPRRRPRLRDDLPPPDRALPSAGTACSACCTNRCPADRWCPGCRRRRFRGWLAHFGLITALDEAGCILPLTRPAIT